MEGRGEGGRRPERRKKDPGGLEGEGLVLWVETGPIRWRQYDGPGCGWGQKSRDSKGKTERISETRTAKEGNKSNDPVAWIMPQI